MVKLSSQTLTTIFKQWIVRKFRIVCDIILAVLFIIIIVIQLGGSPEIALVSHPDLEELAKRVQERGDQIEILEAKVEVLALQADPEIQRLLATKVSAVGTGILIIALILLVVGIAMFTIRLSKR